MTYAVAQSHSFLQILRDTGVFEYQTLDYFFKKKSKTANDASRMDASHACS
jgi:hypothetical protein